MRRNWKDGESCWREIHIKRRFWQDIRLRRRSIIWRRRVRVEGEQVRGKVGSELGEAVLVAVSVDGETVEMNVDEVAVVAAAMEAEEPVAIEDEEGEEVVVPEGEEVEALIKGLVDIQTLQGLEDMIRRWQKWEQEHDTGLTHHGFRRCI